MRLTDERAREAMRQPPSMTVTTLVTVVGPKRANVDAVWKIGRRRVTSREWCLELLLRVGRMPCRP